MPTCFVIQPFDGGAFDKRFQDVLVPAIKQAGLEPYRVDRDPNVTIPIEDIESGIRSADVCLADITLDNPNVWFELGFAISIKKHVIIICSEERTTRFPFDVQHRSIIKYHTQSPSDFDALKNKISERLNAILRKEKTITHFTKHPVLADVKGLSVHEVTALVLVGENSDHAEDKVSMYTIRQDMENLGFAKITAMMALESLKRKTFVEDVKDEDSYGNLFISWSLTSKGMDWLLANEDRLVLKKPPTPTKSRRPLPEPPASEPDDDEDIPF